MRPKIQDALNSLCAGEIPDYIVDAGKTFVKIRVDNEIHKVTMEDVAHYYTHDACNIVSGCRQLGSIVGDWRPIDYLARELLYWFKSVNIEGLRRMSRRYGLEPKF